MNYRNFLILSCMLCLGSCSLAASGGGAISASLTDPLGIAKDDGHQAAPEVPSPRSLDPQWWDYFIVPPEQLNARVDSVNADLDKLLHELDPSAMEGAKPLIARITTNLKGFSELIHQKSSKNLFQPLLRSIIRSTST